MSIGLPDATGAEPWQGNGEVTCSRYFVNRKEPAFSMTAVIETVALQRSLASVGSLLPFSHCSTEKRGHPHPIGTPLFSKQNEAGPVERPRAGAQIIFAIRPLRLCPPRSGACAFPCAHERDFRACQLSREVTQGNLTLKESP